MKHTLSILLTALLFILQGGITHAQTNTLSAALQQGLFEEEANNNLEAAIQAYKSVMNQFDRDRKLAATAIYRLGECYRKQNKTNEAVLHYERVVKEFADVTTLATMSGQNLAGLGTESKGASVSEQAAGSPGAPITSAEEEEVRRIRALIQNSPDLINAPSGEEQKTPLQSAASAGQLIVARFLLENGADPNLAPRNWKPLVHAASAGHLAMVQLLLQYKADISGRDWNGTTALHAASGRGFTGIVELLLKSGAEVDVSDQDGNTPLQFASRNGHYAVTELLLARKANVNGKNKAGSSPLHAACKEGQSKIVPLLIKHGADVNMRSGAGGETPLGLAAIGGYSETLKLLLANKADPNLRNDSGAVPLYSTLDKNKIGALRVLLEGGANPNQALIDQDRVLYPIHFPIALESPEMMRLLLEHKANPNAKQKPSGRTALMLLLAETAPGLRSRKPFENFGATAELLLEFKADVNVRDNSGLTALHYSLGQPTLLERILAAGAQVNVTGGHGETPLHLAAFSGLTNAAIALLAKGANINARDDLGNTPLHLGVVARDKSMISLLLARGADPNVRNGKGKTPLNLEKSGLAYRTSELAAGVRYLTEIPQGSYGLGMVVNRSQPSRSDVAELLRSQGALDDLPDASLIQVGRAGKDSFVTVFKKTTNDWNQFSLMEAIGIIYGFLTADPSPFPESTFTQLEFPDFSKISIRRIDSKGLWTTNIVNLAGILESGDCNKDVQLRWGDLIEIPTADHLLSETWRGLPATTGQALNQCWTRHVEIVVRGKSSQLSLTADTTTPRKLAQFWIKPVLLDSKLLLASSDLSRIKVTRSEGGKKKIFVVDCSPDKPAPDFWLRNGDVIEVPDK